MRRQFDVYQAISSPSKAPTPLAFGHLPSGRGGVEAGESALKLTGKLLEMGGFIRSIEAGTLPLYPPLT